MKENLYASNPNDQVVIPFSSGVGGQINGKWDAPEGTASALVRKELTANSGQQTADSGQWTGDSGQLRAELNIRC